MIRIAILALGLVYSGWAVADDACPEPSDKFRYLETKLRAENDGRNEGKLRIFYAIEGQFDPALPTLVVIQGGPGGYQMPDLIGDEGREGYNTVHIHHRGVGCSTILSQNLALQIPYEAGIYSRSRFADDIEAVRADLLGDQPWFVYGVSYGTMVAQKYALKYPASVRGLMLDAAFQKTAYVTFSREVFFERFIASNEENLRLFETAVERFPNLRKSLMRSLFLQSYRYTGRIGMNRILQRISEADTQEAAQRYIFSGNFIPMGISVRTGCEEMWDHPDDVGSNEFFFWFYNDVCKPYKNVATPFDHTEELRTLSIPTVIMGGAMDPVTPIEAMREMNELLPSSILFENEYAGHSMLSEKPVCTQGLIDMFVTGSTLEQVKEQSDGFICQTSPILKDGADKIKYPTKLEMVLW